MFCSSDRTSWRKLANVITDLCQIGWAEFMMVFMFLLGGSRWGSGWSSAGLLIVRKQTKNLKEFRRI